MRRDLFICIVVVAATLAAYGQVARHDFVNFDDDKYVYENPQVRAGLTWGGVTWAFTTTHAEFWHPLTWLSHMLDCQIFGMWSGGHHLMSVLFHTLNGVLLFLVLRRTTADVWPSAMVALLFALHPLHVESVASTAQRKDVLSTLFGMLTLLAYIRYCERPAAGRYVLVFTLLALGLMSKPMLITLPFVLLMLDFWPLARFSWAPQGQSMRRSFPRATTLRLAAEKVPFILIAVVFGLVTVWAQQKAGLVESLEGRPLPVRLANAIISLAIYIKATFFPYQLAPFYPYPTEFPVWKTVVAGLFLAVPTGIAFWRAREAPFLVVGWLWYLITLLPVIGLVQTAAFARADRYTYIPLIGFFVLICWGLPSLLRGWHSRQRVLTLTALVCTITLIVMTRHQASHWKNSITLWEHTLRVTKSNALAHNNLGLALQERGRTEEAIRHYREALRIDPATYDAHGNLGIAMVEQGRREEGMKHYQEALRINPASARAHNNLGNEWMALGETGKAIAHYEEALRINPEQAATHSNLGNALMAEGRHEEAVAHYQESIRIDPGFARAHNNLGLALVQQGKRDEAIALFREALRLEPDYADGHYNLGLVWAGQGRLEEARHHYRQAVRIDPRYTRAHYELGVVSLRQGRKDEAIDHFRRVLALDAEDPLAHRDLAMVLAEEGKHEEAIDHYREAIRLRPNDPSSYNNLAWIRATHPDPKLRKGVEAVRLAQKACQLWGRGEVDLLDTLAAAFAEAGRFSEALATLEEAISLATSAGLKEKTEELERRLQGYRAGHPYRQAQKYLHKGKP
jgi:tetratricopeptide (TPR) repeat protein